MLFGTRPFGFGKLIRSVWPVAFGPSVNTYIIEPNCSRPPPKKLNFLIDYFLVTKINSKFDLVRVSELITVVMELFKYPILMHSHRRRPNPIPVCPIESRFSSFLKQVIRPARKPSALCQGFSWNPAVLWDVWNNRSWRFFDSAPFFKYPDSVVLCFWIFFRYSEPTVIKSTKYPPTTGWNRHEKAFRANFLALVF